METSYPVEVIEEIKSKFDAGRNSFREKLDSALDQKKIAIVEDDYEISQMYRRILTHYGYDAIFVAKGGEEIVKAFNIGRESFDIVIMDYRISGMNGLQAAKELTRRDPNAKIILASGDASIESEVRASGFDFICTPFSKLSLIELVNTAISDQLVETVT
jgi:DNA-binding NtrC family response regulator